MLSFPTRRSSDLEHDAARVGAGDGEEPRHAVVVLLFLAVAVGEDLQSARNRSRGGTIAERQSQALDRSEEHTSELQSPCNLVCRLLLEKKKLKKISCATASITSSTYANIVICGLLATTTITLTSHC